MALSKKHYEAIAEILREVGEDEESDRETIEEIAREMSSYFGDDNPRFATMRFIAAATDWEDDDEEDDDK